MISDTAPSLSSESLCRSAFSALTWSFAVFASVVFRSTALRSVATSSTSLLLALLTFDSSRLASAHFLSHLPSDVASSTLSAEILELRSPVVLLACF